MTRQEIIEFGKKILQEWQEDHAPRLAAALAYYTVFALPPLLVLALVIAGQFYNTQSVQEQMLTQVGAVVGSSGQQVVRSILENASQPGAVTLAAIASFLTLLFGASGAFLQLQDTLNTIWEVQPDQDQGIWDTLKTRVFSFILVIAVGVLLFGSMLLGTFFSTAATFLSTWIPQVQLLVRFGHTLISFGIVSLLFALIFKYVPDVKIEWRDVWIGALFTAVLFSLGNWGIGLYLARTAPGSSYGAAGSLIVILLWIYYSAQILFLGAEFTQVYANQFGSRLLPDAESVPIERNLPASAGASIPRKESAPSQTGVQPPIEAQETDDPLWQPSALKQLIQMYQNGLINLLGFLAAITGILSGIRSDS